MRIRLLAAAVAVAVVATGVGVWVSILDEDTSIEDTSSGGDTPIGDTGTRPVITFPEPLDAYPFAGVSGELRLLDGCLVLGDDVVFWPHGSDWDESEQAVTFAGSPPAHIGQTFVGGGGHFEDTTNYVSWLGEDAGTAIEDCLSATGLTGVVLAYPIAEAEANAGPCNVYLTDDFRQQVTELRGATGGLLQAEAKAPLLRFETRGPIQVRVQGDCPDDLAVSPMTVRGNAFRSGLPVDDTLTFANDSTHLELSYQPCAEDVSHCFGPSAYKLYRVRFTGPTRGEPSTPCEPAQETVSPDDDEVLVYFACGSAITADDFRAFTRPVEPDSTLAIRLDTAVSAYFAGPLQREGRYYFTFAGPKALNETAVQGTRAVIDIDLDGVGSTTSYQSGHIWNALRLLAFQFPSITEMEPRYNGSCAAFGGAVEAGECLVALRDGRSVPGP